MCGRAGGAVRGLGGGLVAFALQFGDPVGLAVRLDLADHRIDADFAGDAPGYLGLVARQHHRADAACAQRRDGLTRAFLDCVLLVARLVPVGGRVHHAARDGAGLVEHHGADATRLFQRLGTGDQHAVGGAQAQRDRHRQRRGQSQRARAGDDQHTDRSDQRVRQLRRRAQ